MNPSLSVSIVTYNNAGLIRQTVESLMRHSLFAFTLYIIDNRSTDDTCEVIAELARNDPHIILIRNASNLGFGKGHNVAIQATTADYHLICNPDVSFGHEVIPMLARFMDQNPDVGIVCPKILNPDGSIQAVNRRQPNALDLALRRFSPPLLKNLFKSRLLRYEMQDVGYGRTYDSPCLSGAFLLCRTDVLRRIGGFDERYFMYFDDVDLCRKVQACGYRTVFHPEASITHSWGRGSYKNLKMTAIHVSSAFKYFNKWGWKLW